MAFVNKEPPAGRLAAIFERRIRLPRPTQYEAFCARVGKLMLDLPIDIFPGQSGQPIHRLRHCDELYPASLENWVLTVLEENRLAAMLLLDVLDYLSRLLDRFSGKRGRNEFPLAEDKKRFTEALNGPLVEFQVPMGWELCFAETVRLPGFRGVASIPRCHLSQCSAHVNFATGRLVGCPAYHSTHEGYFAIRCEYLPDLAVADGRLCFPDRSSYRQMGITIPYTFILHEIAISRRPDEIRIITRPTDEEVLQIAERAIDRLLKKGSRPDGIAP